MLKDLIKEALALDADRWITVKPNGPDKKGQPALLGEGGEVKGGMGGKFNGKNISEAKSGRGKSNAEPKNQASGQPALDPSKSVIGGEAEMASLTMLKPAETKAFAQYVHDSGAEPPYKEINESLRSGGEAPEKYKEVVEKMDEAFARASTTSQISVFRGVPGHVAQEIIQGESHVDKGFTSTSASEGVARSFAGDPETGAVMEIIIPKGSKAISMYDVPKDADVGDEHEILLNRGGRYTVREIREGKPKRIIVEYSDGQNMASDSAMRDRLAFDRASQRRVDENGFLHVAETPISKETVNEYYGREIPGWQKLGLDPDRIYRGYRPGSELAKAASTFNGLPLLKEHVPISAEDMPEELRAGNLGTSARFAAPYLYNGLVIQDAESIENLDPKDGSPPRRQISSAYRYDPVFKPGRFRGQPYDFVMTNIRGNHAALVEEGRAGPDVVVADEQPQPLRGKIMAGFMDKLKGLIREAEAKGASPHPGGEEEARQFMNNEEKDAAVAGDDEAGNLGERAFALIDGLEDKELADFLKSLVEGARMEESAQPGTDEDVPAGEVDEKAEEIAAKVEEVVKEVLEGREEAAEVLADQDKDEKKAMPPAMDKKPRIVKRVVAGKTVLIVPVAMDSAATVRQGIKAVADAARKVAPLMGAEVDPFAFDSVAGVYAEAMKAHGMDPKKYAPAAYEGIVDVLLQRQTEAAFPFLAGPSLAMDGASADEAAPQFKHLSRIRH